MDQLSKKSDVRRHPITSDGVGQVAAPVAAAADVGVFETYEDALRAACHALGGLKKVGAALRPELLADAAGRWLSDALNAGEREKLSLAQLALLRRMAAAGGVHVIAQWEMRDGGYEAPVAVRHEAGA